MLIRLWQSWRLKKALLAKAFKPDLRLYLASDLEFPELCEKENPNSLRPYEGLHKIWDEYNSERRLDYVPFIAGLARQNGLQLDSVLDLACGTGTLARGLSTVAEHVTGLDSSEQMLGKAKSHHASGNPVAYVLADLREFRLESRFDVIVCAANSLNYVGDYGTLAKVLLNLSEHMRPGGLLVFDTTTSFAMIHFNGYYLHIQFALERMAMKYDFDIATRRQSVQVMLPDGIEKHHRIAIDPADVKKAVAGTGLIIEDYFDSPLLPTRWKTVEVGFCVFVLRKAC